MSKKRPQSCSELLTEVLLPSPAWLRVLQAISTPSPSYYAAIDLRNAGGRLPIISRDELSQHPERMIATKLSDVDLASTSGSSGKPVRFYLPKNRRSAEWAFMVKAWNQACGYALGDWRALMRGLEFKDS